MVYFAPDDHHMTFFGRDLLTFNQSPPVNHVRPSASVLLQSVAQTYGGEAIGVLLTGMGEDGALGMKAIRDCGGMTIAQDEATSIVYGMPKAAFDLGAVDLTLPIHKIAPTLIEWVHR
jgi:two-component system chemotaxis response regulator CheB